MSRRLPATWRRAQWLTSGLTYFNSYAQTVRFRLGLVELAPDSTGGAATYGRAMREILSRLSEELSFDLIRLVNESSKSSISGLDDSVVTYRKWAPPVSPWRRLFFGAVGQSQKQKGQNLPQVLEDESIDLVWFLAPNQVIEQVRDVPFVMTVWDLAHREVQGFPEFNSGRGWSRRESWYTNNIGRAFHVVTDSTHTGTLSREFMGSILTIGRQWGCRFRLRLRSIAHLPVPLTRPISTIPQVFGPTRITKF